VGRDDDLVDLLRGEHVFDRHERLVVEDAAMRRDSRSAKRLERAFEPAAGRRTPRVAVDDVALARLRHRSNNGSADRVSLVAAPYGVHELGADERLVGDDEDGGHASDHA
jgi:hypothetical protein